MSRDELFEFACERLGESDAAVKILDHASGEEIWIPLSQVDRMSFNDKGEGTIWMTAWIAKKKGLF